MLESRFSLVLENQFDDLDLGTRRRGAVHKKCPGADEFHTSNETLQTESSFAPQMPIDLFDNESDLNDFKRSKISVNNNHFDFKDG